MAVFKRLIGPILVGFTATSSLAAMNSSPFFSDKPLLMFMGYSGGIGQAWHNLNLGGDYSGPSQYSATQLTLTLQINQGIAYGGLEASQRFALPYRGSPFVGLGGYSTKGQTCDDDPDKGCQGFSSMGLYPELGAHFWMSERIKVQAWGRYYLGTRGSYPAWGLGLSIR